jgi:acetyl esterase/lipase
LVITASRDYLAAEGKDFVDQLKEMGVAVQHRHLEDVSHGEATMFVSGRADGGRAGFDNTPTLFDAKQKLLNSDMRKVAWSLMAEQVQKAFAAT